MTGSGANAAAMVATAFGQALDVVVARAVVGGDPLPDFRDDVRRLLVQVQQRLGVDADLPVDDEFQPGQAHAVVGQLRERKGLLGGADVHHDLDRGLGQLGDLGFLDHEVQESLVDHAGLAVGAGHGHLEPVGEGIGGVPGADDGGNPQFPGDDGRVAGASAAVGHDGGGALHDRFPVRVGHVGDQDVAGLESGHLVDRGEDADAAGADALADRAALDQHPAGPVQAEAAQAAGGPAGLHGFRACLQDVQAAVDPVLAPLDVHRAAVVVFDGDGVPGELLDVVVREAEAVPQRGLDRDEVNGVADFAVAGVGHLERLLAQPALEDRRAAGLQGRLVDVELVRVDGALDDGLAEAVGGGDEDGVLEPGFGVHGEHDAGGADVGTHHALDARRECHFGVLELVVHAVGDGPVVVEGREDILDGLQDVLDAADVQEGFLLAGEGGVGKVFRRRAGADGPGEVLGARRACPPAVW